MAGAEDFGPRLVAVLVLTASLSVFPCHGGLWAAQEPAQPPAEQKLSPAALDELLAPIALYPDPLLIQVLVCATSPFQVGAVHDWLVKNPNLKGSELQEAAQAEGFDPSFVALVPFAQVVNLMAAQMDWTRRLGQAFREDRTALFDSVQRLRAQAQAVGNLKSSSQQEVKQESAENGQQVIVIEPANPQIIYVPQYNPQVVYTTPPQQTTTTVVVEDDSSDEIAAAAIGFTAGIIIGATTSSYYWGPYGWHGGGYWYADAWDDFYDNREDVLDDWYDHREDMREGRSDRVDDRQTGRSDRQTSRGESRSDRQTSRGESRSDRQTGRQETQTDRAGLGRDETSRPSAEATDRSAQRSGATSRASRGDYESRGYSQSGQMSRQRSGTSQTAFSGYGSGSSTRASSARGRSSMGSRGGGRRR